MRHPIALAALVAATTAGCGTADGGHSPTVTTAAKPHATVARTAQPEVHVSIDSPADFSQVHRDRVAIRGTVDPPDARVEVAGHPTTKSGPGRWTYRTRDLDRGENELNVSGTAPGHKSDLETVTLIRRRSRAELAAAAQARRLRAQRAEASYRAEAKHLDYDQLIKDPDRFAGTKAAFSGKVLQAREEGGHGFMLLETSCDEFDICDDLVYVRFERHVSAAADDHVTVYGTVTGGYEYDTQAGGSNFVPAIHLRYIDE